MSDLDFLIDKHKGETGIVIANGAGLKNIPLEFLRKYPSIGVNKIFMLDDFTATYYLCIDFVGMQGLDKRIEEYPSKMKFMFDNGGRVINSCIPLKCDWSWKFHANPPIIVHGGSVIVSALEIALWMGFSTILLVGLDHKYTPVKDGENDPNHFTPKYLVNQDNWKQKTYQSDEAWDNHAQRVNGMFSQAKEAYEAVGSRIINLSTPTACDIFEKDDWRNWL